MGDLRLEELSAKNIVEANALSMKPGQEHFIEPVSYAMAGPFLDPGNNWSRVVVDGDDKVVAFLMANFDPNAHEEEFRSCIWRMNVAANTQGKGVGRFAVVAAATEAKKRGFSRLTVIWEPGEDGPEEFFLRVGFTVVEETRYGEKIGAIELP
jgi:GNAT superfamily N-acetyltransferase